MTSAAIQGALPQAADDSDLGLLRAFSAGDEGALATLAARHERAMLGLARGLLGGDRELARDAVQDTWMRVIRSARTHRGDASVKTWLYRILVHRCHDLRSKRGRHNAAPLADAPAGDTDDAAGTQALLAALDALTPPNRILVLLCYHQGLTHAEAAAVMEIPIGTLKSRLHGLLTKLRETLRPEVAP